MRGRITTQCRAPRTFITDIRQSVDKIDLPERAPMVTNAPPVLNGPSLRTIGLRIFRDQVLLITRVTAVWDFRMAAAFLAARPSAGHGR